MDDRENHWYPERWSNVKKSVSRVRAGDIIHNPFFARDARGMHLLTYSEASRIQDEVIDALAQKGLAIDHPSEIIGFVQVSPG